MAKKFVFRSNKYNITHQDIQRGIEDRGYIDNNYNTSNQANPLDKWYKYSAARDDVNVFPSSSVNVTKIQIHDAINRLYDFLNAGQINLVIDKEPTYYSGYNFNKQKVYNYVEEYLLQNPSQVLAFTKDPQQFLISLDGLPIKNILIYQGNENKTNTTLPLLKTNIGEKVGHHKDGKFEKGLQGPFTEQNVGGYKHRHQKIGTTSDRPERFKIADDGTTITFSSPISSSTGLNYNIPYARFSRDGFVKSSVNIRNIKTSGSNPVGNFSKNYEVVNGLHRRNQNLALVDQPQNFSVNYIDNPYVSGTAIYGLPDRRLLDGTYNKSVFVNKFGAPGDVNSTNPDFMDSESEEYSPYNTINYRNSSPRSYLKSYLSTPSYFGGYKSASFGITASYQKTQRNNRRIPISGSSIFRLREDNQFVNYQIPARDGGFLWISNYTTGGNNPGLYRSGIENDIIFITNSIDSIGFSKISSSFYSFSGYSSSLDINETNVLRKYNIKFNGLWNFSSKQQLSNHDNKIVEYQRNNNIFTDEIYKDGSRYRQPVSTKDSAIKDKYTNVKNIYEQDGIEKETLSYEFAQKYSSIMSNYYDAQENKIKNFYNDQRNIKYKDKSKSTFKKLLDYDRFIKSKNISGKKIKEIKYKEKIYPRGQNAFRNFARARNAYYQKWTDNLDNRLTELTNSQGQVYVRDLFLNKYTTDIYKYSFWPMDSYEDSNISVPGIFRDKSGELMQLDNINSYYRIYSADPGLIVPSGTYFGARFGRNWNTNRPANVVHEQAGRGPYPSSYDSFTYDIKLIGQNCSVLPEYRISPKLDLYYSGNISIYDDQFNSLELTGTMIEDLSIAVSTSSAFLEQRVNSDYIDVNEYLNNELEEYKLNSIKFSIKAIKKLLPYEEFYPQIRMLKLAQQFSSSYSSVFTLRGTQATFRTALTPIYAPGIAFNSVKAGVGMPFSVVNYNDSRINNYSAITSSINNASSYYDKLPWDTILYPYKRLQELSGSIIYDTDPDMIIDSSASILTQVNYNVTYDYMANNFYSEVINFFKNSSELTSLKSQPDSEWYFPDLTKKYTLDIVINKQNNFVTYTSLDNFGPKPYSFHCPPWYRVGSVYTTSSTFNSDTDFYPNQYSAIGQSYVRITFDPGSLFIGSPDYALQGKFNIGDILRNSTVEYISSTTTSSAAVQLSDIVDIFGVSSDGKSWQPKLNWECPTADLNFYNLSAKLTNSSGNDRGGGTIGSAIRGIWHQYAPISNNTEGLFLTVRSIVNDSSLTGSLLDVVKFDKSERKKIGKIASSKEISEALIIIPFYTDDCGEEKYFDIDTEIFERMYQNNHGIVAEIKSASRKYVLPPQLDYIRVRDEARKKLEKDQYNNVKSPFLMFPIEFSSILTKQDLADIWQGVMPAISTTADVEYKEKEFFIGNYLRDLNFKLPDNTRFKVFKVKRRAVTNYQQIIDRTTGKDYVDISYGYNWPYDFFSLVEMAEIKAELNYSYDVKEDSQAVDSEFLNKTIVENILTKDGSN